MYQFVCDLISLANHLDKLGFYKEANEIDNVLKISGYRVQEADTPPKKYRETGAKSRSDYADPDNYKYPIDTEKHVRAAISYFSNPKNAGKYSVSKQKAIWGRIRRAAKRFKIEIGKKSGPPSVEG